MLVESFACLCGCVWKSAFKLATGFFVMGQTRSWWEIPRVHWGRLKGERSWRGGGGVGAPNGALSHDDILKQIRPGLLVAAHTFVSGHSLCCLRIQQKPTRGFGESTDVWRVISRYDCKVWNESVCEFRGWAQTTGHIWEFAYSSSSVSKIK